MEAAAGAGADGDRIVEGVIAGHHHRIEVVEIVEEVIVMDQVEGVVVIVMGQVEEVEIVMVPVMEVGEVGKEVEEEDHGAELVLVIVWPGLGVVSQRFNGTLLDYQFLKRISTLNTLMSQSDLKEMPKIGDVLLTSLSLAMEFRR